MKAHFGCSANLRFDVPLTGLVAIRSGTLCNKESDRHTMRIHGQVYLGVEPPFVRLIS